jgi:hypothetical protein
MNKSQINSLQRGFDKNSNYLDINYEVLDSRYPTVLKGGITITSALKMWLQSKRNDYHRNPGFGGFFDNMLNDRWTLSPDNEEEIKSNLILSIEKKFPEIKVIAADVRCDLVRRSWIVKLIVQDLRTNQIMDDMAIKGEGLSILV